MNVLKQKLTDKETLFGIALFCIGLSTFQFTSHLPYLYKLLYRFAMIIVVMYIYRKFINTGEMKTSVKNWRLKGKIHIILVISGLIEFICLGYIKSLGVVETATTPSESVDILVATTQGQSLTFTIIGLLLSTVVLIPVMYSLIQLLMYVRLATVWVYNNHRKWFTLSVIGFDLLFTALTSIMM